MEGVPQGGRGVQTGLGSQTGLGWQLTTLGLHMNMDSRQKVPPLTAWRSDWVRVRMRSFP